MEHTLYHSILRISVAVLTCVLVFQSGLLSPITTQLSARATSYVANAVGISASVTPTEVNQLTAELTKQKTELDAREAQIAERELAIGITGPSGGGNSELTTYLLSSILFILLVLVGLNYALDFARERRRLQAELSDQVLPSPAAS